ncbi:MAG: hypothetical protein NTZ40_00285 [Cyanobacteria bacterium]|nr:hypothetical protein [Cyanobacteriota bacterium]
MLPLLWSALLAQHLGLGMAEAATIEGAQLHTAQQQPLELISGGLTSPWGLRPWWRCLRPRALWVSVISQSLLIKESRHCPNQSSARGLRSSGVTSAHRRGNPRSPQG